MQEYFKFKEIDEHEVSILEMPYKEKGLSMIFVLPHEISGLVSLTKKMNDSFYASIFKHLEDPKTMQKIKVSLPKFNISSKIDVSDSLWKSNNSLEFENILEDETLPKNQIKFLNILSFMLDENGFEDTGKLFIYK